MFATNPPEQVAGMLIFLQCMHLKQASGIDFEAALKNTPFFSNWSVGIVSDGGLMLKIDWPMPC